MARIDNITFACENPVPLSEFWAAALDYTPIEVPPEVQEWVDRLVADGKLEADAWAMLVPREGDGPRLLFQRRPKTPTTDIPIHLDIKGDHGREAEVERLTALGATIVEVKSNDFEETWTVMRDPEGNGFCVS